MTAEKVSRYIIISTNEFKFPFGHRKWRIVYGTRKGRLLALNSDIANSLTRGIVPQDHDSVLPALRKHEIIVDTTEYEGEAATLARRSAESVESRAERKFILLPSTFCNMGCTYCGQEHFKSSLSHRHRSAIIDRVRHAIESSDVHVVDISWFGAEPMMGYAAICQMSKIFVPAAQASAVHYKAKLVTNGTLLTIEKLVNLHVNCGIKHIEITLDGVADVHDSHRPLKSGGKSFEKIVTTISQALSHPDLNDLTFGLRTNVDQRNADSIPAYITEMAGRGFQDPRIRFTFAPVHSWSNDVSAIEVARAHYARLEATWLRMLLDNRLNFDILPDGPNPGVCPAVSHSAEVITSTGTLFSCTEEPLVPSEADRSISQITDIALTSLRPDGAYDTWLEDRVTTRFPCGECVYLGVCGGHCPKNWAKGIVSCPSYIFNIQDRLDLAALKKGLVPVSVEPV